MGKKVTMVMPEHELKKHLKRFGALLMKDLALKRREKLRKEATP